MGTNNVAAATATMRTNYVGLRLVLIVGVYSGLRRIANMDVFLGDVGMSKSVIQSDYGRQYPMI